jgi:hypothetical protein
LCNASISVGCDGMFACLTILLSRDSLEPVVMFRLQAVFLIVGFYS